MAITLVVKNKVKSKKPMALDVMKEIALFAYNTGELHDPEAGYEDGKLDPNWKWLQILSAVVLPDDPKESPHDYFDYSGMGGDEFAQGLMRGEIDGHPAEFWAKGDVRIFLDYLYAKFPKVRHE